MSSSSLIVEGVLAINKPPAISSAQVIRDVQEHFNPSKLFRPWLDREQAKRDAESHNQKKKRKWRGRRENSVKMGHGGTLDPMATGVLILGVGNGTKQLGHFTTECTKSYETVVLFGAATDTYDTEGKIVGRKPYEHITKDMVEEALGKFRGEGMQKPPIFSALKMHGKKLYEYAREGKEPPEEIKLRPVQVHELEMTEWMEGGTHEWHWPEREAEQAEKQFAEKLLHFEGGTTEAAMDDSSASAKRKRGDEDDVEKGSVDESSKRPKVEDSTSADNARDSNVEKHAAEDESSACQLGGENVEAAKADGKEAQPESSTQPKPASLPPCPAPACKIRMTVTSGFYVRSLCQDLGAAVGSLGLMASLVRTRQGDFKLGENVLWYDELKQGEDVWGPKVRRMLESSTAKVKGAAGEAEPGASAEAEEDKS